eukprot:TRINITY_DN10883_c0_g1_i2.p1 TRINITY_DN10883_c0_g1~~TRINITY_DN10883_c0_g1_i2.p1  ORF type:complete len:343 (-),score=85.10 TRINITY_DN10883_c0_g1_i2:50-1078(-)
MSYRSLTPKAPELVVSSIGLGCGSLGSFYGAVDEQEGISLVKYCIKSGINFIDTAPWYGQGQSENIVGKALKEIPRQAYFLATKVGRYENDILKMFDFSYKKTIESVNTSLERLGVDYIDVIQIHDCEFAESYDILIKETLPALKTFVDSGKCRYIGLTGYPLKMFEEVLDLIQDQFNIISVLSYCRFTLFDKTLLTNLDFYSSRKIGVINAAPIAMGILSSQGPPHWHPANQKLKEICADAAKYCDSKNVSIAKLAVWFSTHTPEITITLVSSPSAKLMGENVETAVTQELSQVEKETLAYVEETFFKDLKPELTDWSEVDHARYKEKLQKARDEKENQQK